MKRTFICFIGLAFLFFLNYYYSLSHASAETKISSPPDTEPVEETLSSKYMEVTIDQVFPRVMDYNVDGKVMEGQESPTYGLKVNDVLYYPEIDFEKINDHQAEYTMTVKDKEEDLDATFILSLDVKDNKVIYNFDDIKNKENALIKTIEFVDMNFISVNANDNDAEAELTNFSSDVTKPGDHSVEINDSMDDVGTTDRYYTAFLSTDELSAGVWSSSEVDGHDNLTANRYDNENEDKAMGIGSSKLYYHRDFMSEPSSNQPTIKIAIAEDLNDDNKVDWQDGAIAYRDIMQDIKGWQNVNNNVATRIATNFGSEATSPFLKTLDNVKKTALATDGIGQSVQLKGYQNEGHDSAHPDYDDVGDRMGGASDINTLIEESHKFNTEIGVHINAQEAYPAADAFSDDLIEGSESKGWAWLDQSYAIDKIKDLSSGSRAKRLDALQETVPNLDFIYLDVWYQDQWESNRIAEQFMDRGWRVSTEFGTSIPNYSTFNHWAADKDYGGPDSKGINSKVLRFISNHQKDSWVLNAPDFGGTADHPLLGGLELIGFEGWQSDRNFDRFIRKTFDVNLPTKFLQKYYITNWETTDGDPSETNLEEKIKLKDPQNGDTVEVKRKENSRERVIKLNGEVVLDGEQYLIPWVDQDFESPTPETEKLYHWNVDGGESTWILPEEYDEVSKVNVYQITDHGRKDKQVVDVKENQITLDAEAKTPYIVETENADSEADVKVNDWSVDNHIYDSGFYSGTVDDEYTTIEGDQKAVSVIRTNGEEDSNLSSGDYYLNFDNPSKDTSVSRTLSELEPGEDYVAIVYVENDSNKKASIGIEGGAENVSNYTLQNLQKNYDPDDSHAVTSGEFNRMNRMQVSFKAESDSAKLTLEREAGDGQTKFDDIRIVQKSLNNDVSSTIFEQDFESVVHGYYPFVKGSVANNRIHLSELHEPYTQKGWADKKEVDDVIGGNWSLKTSTGDSGMLFQTIPQNYRFEPGVTYKVNFDYQTTAESFLFVSGNEEFDVTNIDNAKGIKVNEKLSSSTDTKTAEFTVKGSRNGHTYIGIFNEGTELDLDTGEGTFILDNLRIEKVSPVSDVSELIKLVELYEETGEYHGDDVAHSLKLHLTAVKQFEDKEAADKVVKHLKGFESLLEHQSKKDKISEKSYSDMQDNTSKLIDEWQ